MYRLTTKGRKYLARMQDNDPTGPMAMVMEEVDEGYYDSALPSPGTRDLIRMLASDGYLKRYKG